MLSQAEFLKLARDVLTPEDWQKIVRAAVREAIGGDKASRDFIARFCLPEKIEDEVGGEERARMVIFKLATDEDFKRAQEEREAKERAAK